MLRVSALVLALLPFTAHADEYVQMTNGMTCWRNANGELWGCSGGTRTQGSGFNDANTGDRYEYINRQAYDTRTGQVLDTNLRPQEERTEDGQD